MPHPAFDNQLSKYGTCNEVFTRDGQVIYEQTLVRVSERTRDAANQSTSNPLIPGQLRRMSPWVRYGGVNSGVSGYLIREYTQYPNTRYKYTWHGVLCQPGPPPGSISTPFPSGEAEALRNALGRYGQNDVQFGAALQEVGQLTDLVDKYYQHGVKGASQLVEKSIRDEELRKDFRTFLSKGWKHAPSVYLEYLFGMKPLADDISNAVQVLTTMRQKEPYVLVLKGQFRREDTSRSAEWYSPYAGALGNVQADFHVVQLSRATLRFLLPDWFQDRLPPVTFFRQAWETTRLSFVADWVVPVQSWLSGFEGLQLRPFFLDGSVSTLLRRDVSGAYWKTPDSEWTFFPTSSGGRDYSYGRRVLYEFPTEELFSLPSLTPLLGFSQLRVGSALLGQKLASLMHVVTRR